VSLLDDDTTSPNSRRRLAQRVLTGPRRTIALVRPRLPEPGALRWFWLDGLATSAHDASMLTFVPLFLLALGASPGQVGWMTAASALLGTAMLLPGARLAERTGRPHRMVLVVGLVARLTVLATALAPLFGTGGLVVWSVIGLATLRAALNQLALPAWTTIAAEVVPDGVRGRYFASRNLVIALAAVVATPLAGWLIGRVGGIAGYQVTFGLSFAVGLLATYWYARIPRTPRQEPVVVHGKRLPLWQRLRRRPNLLLFCLHTVIWSFSLQLAAPFFNVYLADELATAALTIGLLTTVSTLSSLPAQAVWGRVADRAGPRRVMAITGSVIPIFPLAWLLVADPLHVVPINLVSGFFWAGYNLAAFHFLLAATPDERRPRYVALFNVLLGLANAGGAAVGGWMVEAFSYQSVFLASGVGRALAVLLLLRFVVEPTAAPEREVGGSLPDP
jgi:MFS family permease